MKKKLLYSLSLLIFGLLLFLYSPIANEMPFGLNPYFFINDTSYRVEGVILPSSSPAPIIDLEPGEVTFINMWMGNPELLKATPYMRVIRTTLNLGVVKVVKISQLKKVDDDFSTTPFLRSARNKGDKLSEWDTPSLTYTVKIPFEIGDKYTYSFDTDMNKGTITFEVASIENINGKEYFHFINHTKGRSRGGPSDDPNWHDYDITGSALYYDTGKAKAFEMKDGQVQEMNERTLNSTMLPLYYWMLALDDTFDWTSKYDDPAEFIDRLRFRVVRREEFKGRDSFVVLRGYNGGYTTRFWVDTDTRIMLGMESSEGLKYELIEAPFMER